MATAARICFIEDAFRLLVGGATAALDRPGPSNKRAAQWPPLKLRTARRLFVVVARHLHRAGFLALGGDVAVDEFDHRHRRRIAVAEARLEHADVAALALGIARGQRTKQLLDR